MQITAYRYLLSQNIKWFFSAQTTAAAIFGLKLCLLFDSCRLANVFSFPDQVVTVRALSPSPSVPFNRHHTNPVGTEWRWKMDPAEKILQDAVEKHQNMIRQFRGWCSMSTCESLWTHAFSLLMTRCVMKQSEDEKCWWSVGCSVSQLLYCLINHVSTATHTC